MGPGEKVDLGLSVGCGNDKTEKVSPIIAVRTRENHPNIVNSEVDSSQSQLLNLPVSMKNL